MNVLGVNIGDEQRGADEKPPDVATCQEIVLRGAFFAGEVHSDAKYDGE